MNMYLTQPVPEIIVQRYGLGDDKYLDQISRVFSTSWAVVWKVCLLRLSLHMGHAIACGMSYGSNNLSYLNFFLKSDAEKLGRSYYCSFV